MLEVENIDTFYGVSQALFGVSLSVPAGSLVALMRPGDWLKNVFVLPAAIVAAAVVVYLRGER